LLPFIGTFEDVQVKVGAGGRVSSLCENPLPRGPLSHMWVSIACASPSYYSSSSASSSSSLCLRLRPPRYVLSLSLFLIITYRCLCISLYQLRASPRECLHKKAETGSKLTAP
jgi:hypothetical protein